MQSGKGGLTKQMPSNACGVAFRHWVTMRSRSRRKSEPTWSSARVGDLSCGSVFLRYSRNLLWRITTPQSSRAVLGSTDIIFSSTLMLPKYCINGKRRVWNNEPGIVTEAFVFHVTLQQQSSVKKLSASGRSLLYRGSLDFKLSNM